MSPPNTTERECETCEGTGACSECDTPQDPDMDCEECEGTGECGDCDGSGFVLAEEES